MRDTNKQHDYPTNNSLLYGKSGRDVNHAAARVWDNPSTHILPFPDNSTQLKSKRSEPLQPMVMAIVIPIGLQLEKVIMKLENSIAGFRLVLPALRFHCDRLFYLTRKRAM